MTQSQLTLFIEKMSLTVRQSGLLAKNLQSQIHNEPKKMEGKANDLEYFKAQREAKTIIDETVQDLLLMSVEQIIPRDQLVVDAEEDTKLRSKFNLHDGDLSLIIDPIDGTIEYLRGSDAYSVNIGLVEEGKMLTAMVYFPKRDDFYFINENGEAHIAKNLYFNDLKESKKINLISPGESKIIFQNRQDEALSNEQIESLNRLGYKVMDYTSDKVLWPEAFLKCMKGEVGILFLSTPHPRDILLGAVLEAAGGVAVDIEGNKLIWPQSGRIDKVVFANAPIPEEVLRIFNQR